jgi:hypothetical protein
VFSTARGAPHLDGSTNTVQFTIPGESSPRTISLQPAEVPITWKVTFAGSGLAGDQTTLLLQGGSLTGPVEVGADWGVVASGAEIFATVQALAGGVTVVPGIYSAMAKVTDSRVLPDKSIKAITATSNLTPFTVVPLITAILPPDLSQRVVVQGGVFQDAGIGVDAIDLFVGPQKLTPKAGATLNPGEFEVLDPATLRFRYPIAGVNSGDVMPFRLIVNGAESAPNWVTAP